MTNNMDIIYLVLLTPIAVPFQVPVPIVPTVVITLDPAAGEAPTVL